MRWIMTPRLHGIDHSIVPSETNSNWSSGLTVWDRLHGTLRTDIPQDAITMGCRDIGRLTTSVRKLDPSTLLG